MMQSKSLDWFLYDRDLCHERVNTWCPEKGQIYLNKAAAEVDTRR